MQEKFFTKENIRVYWNTEVQEVLGEDEVSGARLFKNTSREETVISLEGLFIAIGHLRCFCTELSVRFAGSTDNGFGKIIEDKVVERKNRIPV